jgi:DNA-binding protein HU-beta
MCGESWIEVGSGWNPGVVVAEIELGCEMNQSELIEKVVQATELTHAAAGQAVKAIVKAIVAAVSAGEAVRVSGLGSFAVTKRPARLGRNPRTGETIAIAASNGLRFHAGKTVKDALNPRAPQKVPGKKTAPAKNRTAEVRRNRRK